MKRRPLIYVALSMIMGISLSYYLSWQTHYLTIVAIISCCLTGLCLFLSRRFFIFALLITAFFGGAVLFSNEYASELEKLDLSKEYKINGRVVDKRKDNYNILTLDNLKLEDEDGNTYKLSKKAQIYTNEQLKFGDIIQYNDTITLPSPPRNPGTFDNRMYLAANGIEFTSFVYELNIVGNDEQWYFFPFKIRDFIANEIDYYFTSQSAAVAKAMVIGLKEDIPEDLKNEFSQTGISHVLAISGLHITLLSVVLDWFLKKFSMMRSVRFSIGIGFLIFYSILTGLSASVIRASIIGICIIIGKWKFTKRDMMTFLCVALIISLLMNSVRLFMPGFLMSFGVFFGLICLGPQFDLILKRINFENPFSKSLSASIIASIAIFPLTAYFFGGISFIAPIANFFAVPLAMIIVLFTGVFLAFSTIPFIGSLFSIIPQFASSLLIYLNHAVASFDFGFIKTENISVLFGVLTYIIIFLLSDFIFIKQKYKYIAATFCGTAMTCVLMFNYLKNNDYLVKTIILDVGTGDAIHIKTKNIDYLIDNGGNIQYSNLNAYTENNDIIYDGIIISNDRTKNLEKIIKQNYVNKLIVPENYERKDYDNNAVIETYNMNDKIVLDNNISLDPVAYDGKNFSFILKVDDIPICLFAQNSAEDINNIPNVDIIKLSKGGNDESLSKELINNTKSDALIISVKANNSKNLPDPQIIKLAEEYNLPVYTTADKGAITINWKDIENPIITTME